MFTIYHLLTWAAVLFIGGPVLLALDMSTGTALWQSPKRTNEEKESL